jgi:cysteinyl-tRNA synthetase
MSHSCLGEQIDIHGGGNDLIFPHHENEIAQSEAMHGKKFASYWMHNGMMQLSGAAMSKSTGNLVTIDKFLDEYEANVLRMMILNSSYRSPITFNEETIAHATRALKRLRSALKPALPKQGWKGEALEAASTLVKESFLKVMDDDFNTAGALGSIFDFVKEINQARDEGADQASLSAAQEILKDLTSVLGLDLLEVSERQLETGHQLEIASYLIEHFTKNEIDYALTFFHEEVYSAEFTPEIDPIDPDLFVNKLIELRSLARENKDWTSSDYIRDMLRSYDIILEDSPQGTTWHWK